MFSPSTPQQLQLLGPCPRSVSSGHWRRSVKLFRSKVYGIYLKLKHSELLFLWILWLFSNNVKVLPEIGSRHLPESLLKISHFGLCCICRGVPVKKNTLYICRMCTTSMVLLTSIFNANLLLFFCSILLFMWCMYFYDQGDNLYRIS